jgi:hypothetical protein
MQGRWATLWPLHTFGGFARIDSGQGETGGDLSETSVTFGGGHKMLR